MLSSKGQAAVTDALLFLSIVGIISTLIITNAMDYGINVTEGIRENYETTYLYSALKTLYIINYGRDGNYLLETKNPDYLMTLVKEQYSTSQRITDTTKMSLFKELDQIFLAFPQKSYMFALITKSNYAQGGGIQEKPIFIGIRTEGSNDDSSTDKYYLDCNPTVGPFTAMQNYLQNHTINQRTTSGQSIFFKNLISDGSGGQLDKENGLIILSFWTSTPDINEDIKLQIQNNISDIKYNDYDLNCKIYTTTDLYKTSYDSFN